MTKLPKIGGQRLSGITESNNLQVGSFFLQSLCFQYPTEEMDTFI